MKKIVSLFFLVLTVMCMTVSAFASEPPISLPTWDADAYPYAVLRNVDDSKYYLRLYDVPLYYKNDSTYGRSLVQLVDGHDGFFIYYVESGTWEERYVGADSKKGVKLDEAALEKVLWMNFVPEDLDICDGTTCSVVDMDANGVCDTCGKTVSLELNSYPSLPSVDGSNKHYALVKTKYSGVNAYMYSVFTSDATYDIRGETPSTVYQIAVDGVADYIQYVTTDGQNWVEIQNSSVNNQSVGSGIVSQTTVIASTFDWYNEDGEHFFPVPLWVEVEEVTQGEMETMGQTLGGMMKILVPCGVGCLALLMVLNLFGKRSLIFRS